MDFLDLWLPYELKFEDNEWRILFLYLGDHHFNEPFFDETISRLKIKKGGTRFISCVSLKKFMEIPIPRTVSPVTAFIFHVSRCGSTLLSQALSTEKQHIVVPEAPLFDQVLRMNEADPSLSKDVINQLLLKVINWYGQNRSGNYLNYIVKLDSWHVHFYKQLRQLFPTVPFYFLTREPLAILKSHIKRRGIQAIPGYINAKLMGIELEETHFQNFNYYTELVIANFYTAIIEILNESHPFNYFFDYSSGVANMLIDFYTKVLKEKAVPDTVNSRLGYYSKMPDQSFVGDTLVEYQIQHVELTKIYSQLLNRITKCQLPK